MMRAFPSWLLPAMSLLVGLAWGSAASSEPPDYTRTPVLFVHGHGLSSADWRPLIEHLTRIGYPREYMYGVDIVPNTMANVPAATAQLQAARGIARWHGQPAGAAPAAACDPTRRRRIVL